MSKKYTFPAIFLSFLLPFFFFFSVPLASAAERGDVDGNGEIEVQDARLALRQAVGLEKFEETDPEAFLACDADENGEVDVADARIILRVSVGLPPQDVDQNGVVIVKEYSQVYENETIWLFEVQNITEQTVDITVVGDAIDNDGNIVDTWETAFYVIGPQETTVGLFDFYEVFNIDHIDYTLTYEESAGQCSGAKNVTTEVTRNNSGAVVRFLNTGDESLEYVNVDVLFLDGNDQLLSYGGMYFTDVDGPFRPGDIIPAQFYCEEDFDHVKVFCTGAVTEASYDWIEVVPATDLETKSLFLPSYDSTWHLLLIRNTTDKNVEIYIQTEAYNAEGKLVGADHPYVESLAPGEESYAISVFPDETDIRNVVPHISAIVCETPDSGSSNLQIEKHKTDEGLSVVLSNVGYEPICLVEYCTVFFDENNEPVDFYTDGFVDGNNQLDPERHITIYSPTDYAFSNAEIYVKSFKMEGTQW